MLILLCFLNHSIQCAFWTQYNFYCNPFFFVLWTLFLDYIKKTEIVLFKKKKKKKHRNSLVGVGCLTTSLKVSAADSCVRFMKVLSLDVNRPPTVGKKKKKNHPHPIFEMNLDISLQLKKQPQTDDSSGSQYFNVSVILEVNPLKSGPSCWFCQGKKKKWAQLTLVCVVKANSPKVKRAGAASFHL